MRSISRKTLAAGLLLVVGLGSASTSAWARTEKAKEEHSRRVPPPTTEPAPPLSLEFRLANLQKNTSGGVASFSLEAASSVALEEVTFSVRVPSGAVFSDGTQEKTWTSPLTSGGTLSLPFDLLVPKDGKYVLSGEASGNYQGKPVHRALSYKLLVGVQDKAPKVKDGAIEYPGVPGGGM
jgi:hypothetical protein